MTEHSKEKADTIEHLIAEVDLDIRNAQEEQQRLSAEIDRLSGQVDRLTHAREWLAKALSETASRASADTLNGADTNRDTPTSTSGGAAEASATNGAEPPSGTSRNIDTGQFLPSPHGGYRQLCLRELVSAYPEGVPTADMKKRLAEHVDPVNPKTMSSALSTLKRQGFAQNVGKGYALTERGHQKFGSGLARGRLAERSPASR